MDRRASKTPWQSLMRPTGAGALGLAEIACPKPTNGWALDVASRIPRRSRISGGARSRDALDRGMGGGRCVARVDRGRRDAPLRLSARSYAALRLWSYARGTRTTRDSEAARLPRMARRERADHQGTPARGRLRRREDPPRDSSHMAQRRQRA